MDREAIDRAISDHAAALLMRYFANGTTTDLGSPSVLLSRDRELLRLHWALSSAVLTLTNYLLSNRHEIQSILTTTERLEDGIVRGRLDAVATIRHRRLSGHASAVISHEPSRTHASGPNQLLGWVIGQAWSLASRFSTLTLDSPLYQFSINETLQRLEQSRRLQAIQHISNQTTLTNRPTSNSLLLASRSRRKIYRLAAHAYQTLLAIEAGVPEAITEMLRSTLIAPLEPWRRFELMVCYSVAEALADAEGKPVHLSIFAGDTRQPIARAGRYAIFWQWGPNRRVPAPEPSEIVTQSILDAYGLRNAGDRPDAVVYDTDTDCVAGLVEVKYLTSEDATDRIRSATAQIVRYARSYHELIDASALLGSSLIVVSQGMERIGDADSLPASVPYIADFDGIRQQRLREWARRLQQLSPPASPALHSVAV